MAVDSLAPNDPRVEHKFTDVGGGITYHYMLAKPQGKPTATVVLCHGWPDLGMGWRYQVPYLLSLNLQVVVPDMLGYGQTSAPEAIEEYSMKKMSDHVAHIIREVTGGERILLGGHDWGAIFVWRLAMYHPELVRCIFSFCVPFMPPQPEVTTLEQMVKRLPNFNYQLQLASGRAEEAINKSEATQRGFLNGIYGGRTEKGEVVFDTWNGVKTEILEDIKPSPMVKPEVMDHYVKEYSRHGMHGPCNWYKTKVINGEDEAPLARERGPNGFQFDVPAMLVMAGRDAALPPALADGQGAFFPKGLKQELVPEATHWVLVQCPAESNKYIGEFLGEVLGEELKASL